MARPRPPGCPAGRTSGARPRFPTAQDERIGAGPASLSGTGWGIPGGAVHGHRRPRHGRVGRHRRRGGARGVRSADRVRRTDGGQGRGRLARRHGMGPRRPRRPAPRRRHRHRRWRYLHRELRVHRGRPGVPRPGGALRGDGRGDRDRRLQLGHGPAGHRGGDPGLRRARPQGRDGLQLVGRDAGRRRDRPGHLRVQRLRPGRAEHGRRRGRQPERAVLRRPDRPARGRPARRDDGARVRQLDDPTRHRGAAPEGRLGRGGQRRGSATRCTRPAPASPATPAAAT